MLTINRGACRPTAISDLEMLQQILETRSEIESISAYPERFVFTWVFLPEGIKAIFFVSRKEIPNTLEASLATILYEVEHAINNDDVRHLRSIGKLRMFGTS